MMFQIQYYRAKCIGCAACVEVAPSRWRVSKKDGKCNLIEGKAKKGVYIAQVPSTEFAENDEAARSCPVHVIRCGR